AVLLEPRLHVADRRLARRRRRAALAGDLGGDALTDLRLGRWIDEQRVLGLAEHVDEAGRDELAARLDAATRTGAREVANGGDLVAADADVGAKPGRAGAVDDAA